MASLVVSVMSHLAPFSLVPARRGQEIGRLVASVAGRNLSGCLRRWTVCGFKTSRNCRQKNARPERLVQAPDRAKLPGHDKEVRSVVRTGGDWPARDRNDGKRCLPANKSQCFEAVHARHEDVENQEIERFGVEQIETATAVTGGNDIVTSSLEKEPQRHPNSIVVVNNKNSCQGRRSAGNHVNGRLNRYPSSAVMQEFCRLHGCGPNAMHVGGQTWPERVCRQPVGRAALVVEILRMLRANLR